MMFWLKNYSFTFIQFTNRNTSFSGYELFLIHFDALFYIKNIDI